MSEEEFLEVPQDSIWLRGYFTQDKEVPNMIHYHFVNIVRLKLLIIFISGIIGFFFSYLFREFVIVFGTPAPDPELDFPSTIFGWAIIQFMLMIAFALLGYFGAWLLLSRTRMGLFLRFIDTMTMAIPSSKLEEIDKAWNVLETYYNHKYPLHGPFFKLRLVITNKGHARLLELFKLQKKVHLKQFLETEDFFALRDTQFKTSLIFTMREE